MNIVFRTDSSLEIGTGHVMRCLTLANALMICGADCHFICRAHEGNLIDLIQGKGHTVHALELRSAPAGTSLLAIKAADHAAHPAHSHWLGATQSEDAAACTPILAELQPDWLIVDHYALDARWEESIKPYCRKLLVIDDLANRPHACDLLLDQTFGRQLEDYRAWVPVDCQLLCGSQYALLRPEFAALRPYSLQRRAQPQLRHLLITMGGVDKDNATGQILTALRDSPLPVDCRVTVVMGATAPWLAEVERLAQDMPWPTQIRVGVSDMAQLMADSDLAIGAAGATSWERCCLGLPTIMLVLADNQKYAATLLDRSKAVRMLNLGSSLAGDLSKIIKYLENDRRNIQDMISHAQIIADGKGCQVVSEIIYRLSA